MLVWYSRLFFFGPLKTSSNFSYIGVHVKGDKGTNKTSTISFLHSEILILNLLSLATRFLLACLSDKHYSDFMELTFLPKRPDNLKNGQLSKKHDRGTRAPKGRGYFFLGFSAF